MMVALQGSVGDFKRAEPVYTRAKEIANIFNMGHINANNMAMMQLLGAQMYQLNGDSKEVLTLLGEFAKTCTEGLFPVTVRGDEFFDKLDGFFASNINPVPRGDKTVKEDIAKYLHDPIFEPLKGDAIYEAICKKLEDFAKSSD